MNRFDVVAAGTFLLIAMSLAFLFYGVYTEQIYMTPLK